MGYSPTSLNSSSSLDYALQVTNIRSLFEKEAIPWFLMARLQRNSKISGCGSTRIGSAAGDTGKINFPVLLLSYTLTTRLLLIFRRPFRLCLKSIRSFCLPVLGRALLGGVRGICSSFTLLLMVGSSTFFSYYSSFSLLPHFTKKRK